MLGPQASPPANLAIHDSTRRSENTFERHFTREQEETIDIMRKHSWTYLVVALITLSISSTISANDEKQLSAAVKLMTVEELKTKVSANEPVVILDVRNPESYASSDAKIKGAIHVSVRKLKYRLGFPPLKEVPKDRQVVTYCSCPSDEASIKAAQLLMESGFTNVRVLKGGWLEWQRASGPIEARPRG